MKPPASDDACATGDEDGPADPGRRRFLGLMAASAASAALAGGGCSGPPAEPILPYARMPEQVLPGVPRFYATTLLRRGYGQGVLVECNMGRPTKVEGNPLHPASLGATDVFSQAAVLRFWDPDRSRVPRRGGGIAAWSEAESFLFDRAHELGRDRGRGLRVLTGAMTSELWAAQWRTLRRRLPGARWHRHEPLRDDGAARAARLAFGRPVDTLFRFERARVVLALAADPLGDGPGATAHARQFARLRRDPRRPSRIYAVEPIPGLLGANADEALPLAPARIERLAWRLAAALGVAAGQAIAPEPALARWEAALAAVLLAHRGESLLIAGPSLSDETRALVHVLNERLGNVGRTLEYVEPVERGPDDEADTLAGLCADMRAGRVDTLLVLDANPVYDAAGDLGFAEALSRVPHDVHAGLFRDETARRCAWHLPLVHEFEYWGDARWLDGTASLIQPVVRPLYQGRSARALLGLLGEGERQSDHAALRALFAQRLAGGAEGFERAWARCLREGLIAGSAAAPLRLPPARLPDPPRALADASPGPGATGRTLTAVFLPDAAVDDGRHGNNAWLQELPRPLTRLTWDNAALVSPGTAGALGLASGDVIELEAAGRRVTAPLWVLRGQADGTVGIPLGYGRWAAGRVGDGVGFDGYRLRSAGMTAAVELRPLGRRHDFASVMPLASTMEGRPIARHAALERLRERGAETMPAEKPRPGELLYPAYDYPAYAWAMSIDLNACIGCGACTIACQAENNIPSVGRREVMRGREMHWIRVDRYYDESPGRDTPFFQPVPCMHCENAPCELVCPVGATMHDSEGLNVQVYNRCVGTRFCSNNCPYKVRRFNFLAYSHTDEESLKAGRNPEVTVRSRGVMEKCNYCLQRITRARIAAEKEGRRIADGEVVTACQAVCPTEAIVFGDLNDPDSRVSRAKGSPLGYALLAGLNTRPRTTYVARVTNPDAALEDGEG
jgi:molybdopterin-containing oxidoreductase family iron-sulfur binding subunit